MGMEEQHRLGATRLSGAHMRSHSLTLTKFNRPVTPKQHVLLSTVEHCNYCFVLWGKQKTRKDQPYSHHEGAVSLKKHHYIQDSFMLVLGPASSQE